MPSKRTDEIGEKNHCLATIVVIIDSNKNHQGMLTLCSWVLERRKFEGNFDEE